MATPKKSPQKRNLSPDRILDAAAAILDKEGAQAAEALSMRRLGAELGVAAMALYNHFPSRDALLDALANRALASIPTPPPSQSGTQKLRTILKGIHTLATEHPHLYTIAITRPTRPPAALRLMLDGLDALRSAGLSEQAAVRWYHTALMLLQGYPAWHANHTSPPHPTTLTATNLSPRELKHLKAINTPTPTAQFEASLDLLLSLLPTK